MPQTPRQPSYRLHKPSGQAVVTLSGRDHYLGKHDTPESRERHDELVARWLANGRRLPEQNARPMTVKALILDHYRFCEERYKHRRNGKSELSRIRTALRAVKEMFGSTPAASFGPKSLTLVRTRFVADGLSRNTVNDKVRIIRKLFRWGTAEELIPAMAWHGLNAVEGLRAGESAAREPRKVKPVPDEHVDAVLPYVRRPVRAMIEVERLTGMRPGEVTIMRGCDLDTTGPLWVYRPAEHKGESRGHDRQVHIGERAQAIIRPFLRPVLAEYIFRPHEAEAERDAERRRARKTPLWPSHVAHQQRKRKKAPKRTPGDHYREVHYARAIRRGCDRAFPAPEPLCKRPDETRAEWRARLTTEQTEELEKWKKAHRWTPHQLRHSFATRVRKEYGIEAARVMLGHQHVGVTEIYAERDQAVAATIAKKLG